MVFSKISKISKFLSFCVVVEGSYDGRSDGRAKSETKCKLKFDDGSVYHGECLNGKMHGIGKRIFANGEIHEGRFLDGKLPVGKIMYINGDVYEGGVEHVQGFLVKHGNGEMKFADGSVYVGNWKNDKRDSDGAYVHAENPVQYGTWKKDQYEKRSEFAKKFLAPAEAIARKWLPEAKKNEEERKRMEEEKEMKEALRHVVAETESELLALKLQQQEEQIRSDGRYAASLADEELKNPGVVQCLLEDMSYPDSEAATAKVNAARQGVLEDIPLQEDPPIKILDTGSSSSTARSSSSMNASVPLFTNRHASPASSSTCVFPERASYVSSTSAPTERTSADRAEIVLEESLERPCSAASSAPSLPASGSSELSEAVLRQGRLQEEEDSKMSYTGDIKNGERHGFGTAFYSKPPPDILKAIALSLSDVASSTSEASSSGGGPSSGCLGLSLSPSSSESKGPLLRGKYMSKYVGEWRNGLKHGWGTVTEVNFIVDEHGNHDTTTNTSTKLWKDDDVVREDFRDIHIIGGGPVGLTLAASLAEHWYGDKGAIGPASENPSDATVTRGVPAIAGPKIIVYESRWKKEPVGKNSNESEIDWQGAGEGKRRRPQVMTIQGKVWSALPEKIKDTLFEPKSPKSKAGRFCHLYPGSQMSCAEGFADSCPAMPARNMPIADIENRLLALLQKPRYKGKVELKIEKVEGVDERQWNAERFAQEEADNAGLLAGSARMAKQKKARDDQLKYRRQIRSQSFQLEEIKRRGDHVVFTGGASVYRNSATGLPEKPLYEKILGKSLIRGRNVDGENDEIISNDVDNSSMKEEDRLGMPTDFTEVTIQRTPTVFEPFIDSAGRRTAMRSVFLSPTNINSKADPANTNSWVETKKIVLAEEERQCNRLMQQEANANEVRHPYTELKFSTLSETVLSMEFEISEPGDISDLYKYMVLNMSQNRFVMTPLETKDSRVGYFNMWLTPEEKVEAVGRRKRDGQEEPIRFSEPALFCQNGSDENALELLCSNRDKNKKGLFPRIEAGLRLYGIDSKQVTSVTRFDLGPFKKKNKFYAHLSNGGSAFLVGDAAMNVNFRGGRGFNSGLKSVIALSRFLFGTKKVRNNNLNNFNDLDYYDSYESYLRGHTQERYAKFNQFMLELQDREVGNRSLMNMYDESEHRTTVRKFQQSLKRASVLQDRDANHKEINQLTEDARAILAKRMAQIATTFFRPECFPDHPRSDQKSVPPDIVKFDKSFREVAENITNSGKDAYEKEQHVNKVFKEFVNKRLSFSTNRNANKELALVLKEGGSHYLSQTGLPEVQVDTYFPDN